MGSLKESCKSLHEKWVKEDSQIIPLKAWAEKEIYSIEDVRIIAKTFQRIIIGIIDSNIFMREVKPKIFNAIIDHEGWNGEHDNVKAICDRYWKGLKITKTQQQ